MWVTIFRVINLIMAVCAGVCMWENVKLFNLMPEDHKYKTLVAWDVLLLFVLAVRFFIKVLVG